jgi:hypothetical protein
MVNPLEKHGRARRSSFLNIQGRNIMTINVRRKMLRRYMTHPIVFGSRKSETCHQGKMGDISHRGMQFDSPIAIDPGDRVWIRQAPMESALERIPACGVIEATVCWCMKVVGIGNQPFSVGVTFGGNGIESH